MAAAHGPGNAPRARPAAFFDLDRTLVADSTPLLLVEALAGAGLVSGRERAVAAIARRVYRTVGETWIGMQVTRRGVSRFAGWLVDDVRAAAERSVDAMDETVWSEARAIVEQHRADGHLVCIATSTGREIVEPLARRLGVDHLIASEYETDGGRFTGNLVGRWLWGPDKADAIRAFADEQGIDLDASYAYSDSYYDRHLLESVGFPRPVNPDPLLRAYAARAGWRVLEFRNSENGPGRGMELLDLLLPLARLPMPVRVAVEGAEHVPREGAVILASNQRSFLDPLVLSMVAARRRRKLRFVATSEAFDVPLADGLLPLLGQIRNADPAAAHRAALESLALGEAVGIFPQQTIPTGEAFFATRLVGDPAVARLASQSAAAVVPVAVWGTEEVWPRSHRLPRIEAIARRARVHVRVGEPMRISGADARRQAQRIMTRISSMLPGDVRLPAAPTPEQVRAASPPGAS